MITVKIKEHSFLAKLAAKKLKSPKVALVIGHTIYLYNTTREEFLANRKWVRHEVAHVLQYERKGTIRFIISYLLQTFNLGYEYNMYEVEARNKEKDTTILERVEFV
jgi:hypothetical protein